MRKLAKMSQLSFFRGLEINLRQKHHELEFEFSLGYIVSLRGAWAT
jgi:hypothetical protein